MIIPLDAMAAKASSRCVRAVSSSHAVFPAAAMRRSVVAPARPFPRACTAVPPQRRRNASSPSSTSQSVRDRPEKAALVEIEARRKSDAVNPAPSTLPPPLKLPDRACGNVALYYVRMGRAYGSFYWAGVKAVWFNHQAAKHLRRRITKEAGHKPSRSNELGLMTRSEFQLLARNTHDIGKLPFFAVLVALFGEWLPVIVPFIPGAVPGTCRIPKQIRGMREKSEERRRASFRRAIREPAAEQLRAGARATPARAEWPMAHQEYAAQLLLTLSHAQLLHLSSTLDLHSRVWDRARLPPPSFLLRRHLAKHLSYLASDDLLLQKCGGASPLTAPELDIACAERGLDVLGRPEHILRESLACWLARQTEDHGQGPSLLAMLFRRPNAWHPARGTPKPS